MRMKRPRLSMKRTRSVPNIIVDLPKEQTPSSDNTAHNNQTIGDPHHVQVGPEEGCLNYYSNYYNTSGFDGNSNGSYDQRFLATMVSPRYNRRTSSAGEFLEIPHFLRTCGLCKHWLDPREDIYMYRGDIAFCSVECREEQIKNDEEKEKCSDVVMESKEKDGHASPSTAPSNLPENSSIFWRGGTIG